VGSISTFQSWAFFAPGQQRGATGHGHSPRRLQLINRTLVAITVILAMLATAVQVSAPGIQDARLGADTLAAATVADLIASSGSAVSVETNPLAALTTAEVAGIEAQIAQASDVVPLVEQLASTAAAAAASGIASASSAATAMAASEDTTIVAASEGWQAEITNSVAHITHSASAAATSITTISTSSIAGVTPTSGITISDGARQATDFGVATEWWQPIDGGLEQGWTFLQEPAGTNGLLAIDVSVGEGLTAVGVSDTIVRLDATDSTSLWYRDLLAWDAAGEILPAGMTVANNIIQIAVDAAGAAYPVTIDPIITEEQTLLPTPTSAQDRFGTAAAIDSVAGRAIITAPGDDTLGPNTGAVYLYDLNTAWDFDQFIYAPASILDASADFGASAAMVGDVLLVGAPNSDQNGTSSGAVVPYTWDGTTYVAGPPIFACTEAEGTCDLENPTGTFENAEFGTSIDVVEFTPGEYWAIIGSPGEGNLGRAYVVSFTGGSASFIAQVQASDPQPGDEFGASVAISANGLGWAIGSPGADAGQGRATTFDFSGSIPVVEEEILAPTLTTPPARFGSAVGVANGMLAVGAPEVDNAAGAVTVFHSVLDGVSFNADTAAGSTLTGAEGGMQLGSSVDFAAVDPINAVLVYGRPGDPAPAGVSYTVENENPTDPVLSLLGSATGNDTSEMGTAVATDGDRWIVGGPGEAQNGQVFEETNEGFAALDRLSTPGVDQLVRPINNAQFDLFGRDVSIDDNIMAVGAPDTDSLGVQSGAVLMFVRNTDTSPWTLDAIISSSLGPDYDFGASVSVHNGRVAIGAPTNGFLTNGTVEVYNYDEPGVWTAVPVDTSVTPQPTDGFGSDVALSQAGLVVTAPAASPASSPPTGELWFYPNTATSYGTPVIEANQPPMTSLDSGSEVVAVDTDLVVWGSATDSSISSAQWDGVTVTLTGVYQDIAIPNLGTSVEIDETTGLVATSAEAQQDARVLDFATAATLIAEVTTTGFQSISDDAIAIENNIIAIGVDDFAATNTGEVELFSLSGGTATGFDVLQFSSAEAGDEVGFAVDLTDTGTLVTGVPGDGDNEGAVLSRNNIVAANPFPFSRQAVADVDGDWGVIALVGPQVQVFNKDVNWSSSQTLTPPATASANFGFSVAISDNNIAVGDPEAREVSLYRNDGGGTFALLETVVAPQDGPFGFSLDMSEGFLIVGNPAQDFAGSAGINGAFIYSIGPLGLGTPSGVACEAFGAQTNNDCGWDVAVSSVDQVAFIGAPGAGGDAGELFRVVQAGGVWPGLATSIATGATGDQLGWSVATDGSAGGGASAVVGAPGAAGNAGQAFTIDGTILTLLADGEDTGDELGSSVSASGDLLAVGSNNNTYTLYANDAGTGFAQIDTGGFASLTRSVAIDSMDILVAYDDTLFQASTIPSLVSQPANKLLAGNGSELDRLGVAVDIDGDTVVVATSSGFGGDTSRRGAVHVFDFTSGVNSQVIPITQDDFVEDVAVAGNFLVIGGRNSVEIWSRTGPSQPFNGPIYTDNTAGVGRSVDVDAAGNAAIGIPTFSNTAVATGAVQVLQFNGTTFVQTELLQEPNFTFGAAMGTSVAIDGITLITGAPGTGVGGSNDGTVWVYTRIDDASPYGDPFNSITGDGTAVNNFGASVAFEGDRIVVGAPADAGGNGRVYVFNLLGVGGALPTATGDTGGENNTGASVDISGDVIVVGASNGESNEQGHLTTWGWNGSQWVETASPILAADGETSDTLGVAVAIDGLNIVAGAPNDDTNGTNAGAAYTFVADEAMMEPANKITPEGGLDGDLAGFAVEVTGNTLAIGAPQYTDIPAGTFGNNGFGVVYIYERADSASPWVFLQALTAPVPTGFEHEFGEAIALTNDWLAVSSPGAQSTGGVNGGVVYVFNKVGGGGLYNAVPVYEVEAAEQQTNARFGESIDIAESPLGDTLVVGTVGFNGAVGANNGSVELFDLNSGAAGSVFEGSAAGDALGRDVAADGNLIAAGAPQSDGDGDGYVETWELTGPGQATPVETIPSNTGFTDLFGFSTDLSGNRLIVGAQNGNVGGFSNGRAFVYEFNGTWQGPAELVPTIPGIGDDDFGFDVAISENLAVVGRSQGDTANGDAAVFAFDGVTWSEETSVAAADGAAGDRFGRSVAIDFETIFIGAPFDDNSNGATDPGAVYEYSVTQPVLEDPNLTFSLDLAPGEAGSVEVAGGIAATAFDAATLEAAAGTENSIAAAPLTGTPLTGTPLTGIQVGDTPLTGIPLTGTALANTPLIDIGIVDGWETIIAGTDLENVPLVDLTFGDIVEEVTGVAVARLNATPLTGIDVGDTPLTGIPLTGIVLGGIPLTGIPLTGIDAGTSSNAEWCNLLNEFTDIVCAGETDPTLGEVSVFEATLRGLPLTGIPLADTPLTGIPLTGTPLTGINVGDINLEASPLTGIPLAEAPLTGINVTDTPLTGTALADIPLLSAELDGVPLTGIPLTGIPLTGILAPATPGAPATTPLTGIPLTGIPLTGIPTSAPLTGTPLTGTPLTGIPLTGIPLTGILLADTPLTGIPLTGTPLTGTGFAPTDWCELLDEIGGGYDCSTFVDPSTTTIFQLALNGVPLTGIPLTGIPLTGIPLTGIPLTGIPLTGIPLTGIPLTGIPLTGIPLTGTPLTGIPLTGTSLGDIPLTGIDVNGSALARVPLTGIPLTGIPLTGIPLTGIPLTGIPLTGIGTLSAPLTGITVNGAPLTGIPLTGINLSNTPLTGIPLTGIPLTGTPLTGIDGVGVNCDLVDCSIDTLGDAFAAGAVDPATTLGDLYLALGGVRLGDLDGEFLGAFDGPIVVDPTLTLGDLRTLDDMILADLPSDSAEFGGTTLNDIVFGLSAFSYADLIGALINPDTGVPFSDTESASALRSIIDSLTNADGPLEADDLENFGSVTLGDFLGGSGTDALTLEDLGSILGLVEVQAILEAFDPDAQLIPGLEVDLGDLTVAQLAGLTIGDLAARGVFDDFSVAELFTILGDAGLLEGYTLGDLMLALVSAGQLPFGGLDFTEVEVGNLPEGIVPDVAFQASMTLGGALRAKSISIEVELPATATFIPGSGVVTDATTSTPMEPTVTGNTLSWILTGVDNGERLIDFTVRPSVQLGATSIDSSARLLGSEESIRSTQTVDVAEGLEPNDFPVTVAAQDDTIYLTYITSVDDVDVFEFDVAENDQLAIQLSGLSADLDLALYVDPTDPAVGAPLADTSDEDVLIPITDPDQDAADSEPLQDFRRLDDEDANLSLIEVSNSAGTENEVIVTSRLPAGTYYLQVFGANGATNDQPAALQISRINAEARPDCVSRGALAAASASAPATVSASANTAILVNYQRIEQLYSAAERADVEAGVNDFVDYLTTDAVGSQLGVNPVVIPVDSFPSVVAAYAAWDNPLDVNDACDPEIANAIVNEISDLAIDPIRGQLDHIVILGGDDMIPMARLGDRTTVANEFDFRHEFVGDAVGSTDGVNALSATFWEQTYLSDEPYGESAARDLGDRFLYISDIALGRLVETPDQMLGALIHFQTFNGSLDIQTGSVLGYDFLVDGSEEIVDDLSNGGLSVDGSLADGFDGATAWDRTAAINALQSGVDVLSLNAHFDHYRALPAIGDQVPGFEDNLETNDVFGALSVDVVFSMGCHGGLGVSDLLVTNTNQDWAQTFAESQTVFVGNTGFGYGDTTAVAYSERLMALFAEEMVTPLAINGPGTSSTIGQALMQAKNDYFKDTAVFSVYDEKALMEATFYGLPFYQVGLAPAEVPPPPTNATVPDTTGIDTLALTVDSTNDLQTSTAGFGSYFSNPDTNGDPQVIAVPGYPIQPSLTTDISVVGPDPMELAEIAHGAIVLDMTSTYSAAGFDPVIAEAVFNESSGDEGDVGNVVFPAKPVTITTTSNIVGDRQSLVLATGQFSSEDAVQRTDDDVDVLVYYADPAQTDFNPPTIGVVESTLENGTFTVTMDVADNEAAVERVYVLVGEDPAAGAVVNWEGIDLQLSAVAPDRWSGSFQTSAATVEFLVQAVDTNGNVAFATNKARNFGDDTVVVAQPPTPDLEVEESTTNLDPGGSGWYTGDATVTVVTDDPAGAEFAVDGERPFTPLPTGQSSITITGDGLHTWEVQTAAGDQIAQGQVLIDTTGAPLVEIASPLDGAVLVGAAPALLFSCEDPSLQTCDATVDGIPFDEGATDLPTTPGSHVVSVVSTDVFGNTSQVTTTYEVVAASITGTESPFNQSPSGVYTGDVTVELTTNDPQGATYTVDGGTPVAVPTGISSFSITGDGVHTWTATTASGSETATGTVTIDTTDPTATITSPADGATYDAAAVPDLAFACSDVNLASCEASVDGSSVADGDPAPATVGTHDIIVIALDDAGNTTTAMSTYEVTVSTNPIVITSSTVSGPADPSTPTTVDVTFTGDPGATATIDWGDGTSCSTPGSVDCTLTDPTPNGDGTLTGTHTYPDVGPYAVTVTLTSPDGTQQSTTTINTTTCTRVGTSGFDILRGTNGDDVLCGLGGNDWIIGYRGADVIYGGAGRDRIWAGSGDDTVYGGDGRDAIYGSSGNDVIDGEAGSDRLSGNSGNDTILGRDGNDILTGGSGNDTLDGGSGRDWVFGQNGRDILFGGSARDRLFGGYGNDTIDGGSGNDTCWGGPGSDTLTNCP